MVSSTSKNKRNHPEKNQSSFPEEIHPNQNAALPNRSPPVPLSPLPPGNPLLHLQESLPHPLENRPHPQESHPLPPRCQGYHRVNRSLSFPAPGISWPADFPPGRTPTRKTTTTTIGEKVIRNLHWFLVFFKLCWFFFSMIRISRTTNYLRSRNLNKSKI